MALSVFPIRPMEAQKAVEKALLSALRSEEKATKHPD
jgi:hypothetical protein